MKGIVNHGVQAMLKPMKEPLQRSEFFIFLKLLDGDWTRRRERLEAVKPGKVRLH